jgi:GT2 family glycosyltransferase
MGVSSEAFKEVGGFSDIHPGEDPDLVLRLKKLGLKTGLIPKAWVYHKRRTSLASFAKQVYKFGVARSILMKWHSEGKSWKFFAPSIALICLIFFVILGSFVPIFWLVLPITWLLIFVDALLRTGNLAASATAIVTSTVQIAGYGWGFLKGFWFLQVEKRNEREIFKSLFYNSRY